MQHAGETWNSQISRASLGASDRPSSLDGQPWAECIACHLAETTEMKQFFRVCKQDVGGGDERRAELALQVERSLLVWNVWHTVPRCSRAIAHPSVTVGSQFRASNTCFVRQLAWPRYDSRYILAQCHHHHVPTFISMGRSYTIAVAT